MPGTEGELKHLNAYWDYPVMEVAGMEAYEPQSLVVFLPNLNNYKSKHLTETQWTL